MYYCKSLTKEEFQNFSSHMTPLPIEQSYYWGEFQDAVKDRIFLGTYGVFEKNNTTIVAIATCIYIQMKKYSYVWCKQGPYILDEYKPHQDDILHVIKNNIWNIMKEKHLSLPLFFRVHTETKPSRFTPAFTHYIRKTLQINLLQSENEILNQMKPKGRYNIRLAIKKGITIEKYTYQSKNFEKIIDDFFSMLIETTKRDYFSAHPKVYYQKMLEHLKEYCSLYIARYNNVNIAGILVTIFGDTAIYYYGASNNEYRNMMAPYLLQWHAICDAKKKGAKVYDFLGISEVEGDSLTGVTEFKKKFGGTEISYLRIYDFSWIPWKYWIIKILKKIFYHLH